MGLMYPVVVVGVNAVTALELRDQVEAVGLQNDQDFIWTYRQATYDNDGFMPSSPRQVKFEFKDPAMATFFTLKWQ